MLYCIFYLHVTAYWSKIYYFFNTVTGTIIDQSLENSTWLPPFIMLVLFEDQPSAIPQLVELGVGDLLHLKVKWMSKLEK
jgi:hypothetical protein